MKFDWRRKITSRKFWLAVTGFVATLLVAFNVTEDTVTQVVSVITAGATLIAYIFTEGYVDAKNKDTVTPDDDSGGGDGSE